MTSDLNSGVVLFLLFVFNPSTAAPAYIWTGTSLAINCQPLVLESGSNPLWIQQVF